MEGIVPVRQTGMKGWHCMEFYHGAGERKGVGKRDVFGDGFLRGMGSGVWSLANGYGDMEV